MQPIREVVAAAALFAAGCGADSAGGGEHAVDAGGGHGSVDAAGGTGGDETPPEFAGASTAAASSTTSVRVGWEPATDDTTPPESIEYLVYVADASGAHDFAESEVVSAPGASRATVEGLQEEAEYFFVVRARDQAGNIDDNTVEVSADTASPDDTAPEFGGVTTATAVSATSIEVSWSAASDDTTPEADIVYNVYVATTPDGHDLQSPTLTTPGGATSAEVTALASSETYYALVRAEDLAGNEDANEVVASATTDAVSFSADVEPIFSANCTARSCHGSAAPKEGLELTEGAAYGNLVEVASEQCGNFVRVAPGDPSASYLIRKLTNDRSDCFSGSQMPSSGNPLSSAELEVIRAWIEAGAADD